MLPTISRSLRVELDNVEIDKRVKESSQSLAERVITAERMLGISKTIKSSIVGRQNAEGAAK